MKKNLFLIFLVVVILLPVFSQVDFSGSADISIFGNIPESDGYESLMNPGNAFGVQDFGMMASIIAKLDAGDESTSFSAWLSMKEFPDALGNELYAFDLMRLSASIYLTDNLSMEIGRQSMLTGYGYGWNPIDFANPLKNPADPDADLRGVDGIAFRLYPGDITSLKLYGILPDSMLSSGLDYEEIKVGTEAVFYLPGMELRLAGLWDYDISEGSDAYTPSLGSALMIDLFGVGIYGEVATRKGSRNYFADGAALLPRKTDWLVSGLVGVEYTFESELYTVIEYFYNGEGYDKSERSNFENTIINTPALIGDLLNMYSPGYFAEHYILINLMQPFYDFDTVINLSALYSPDSGALTIMPSLDYSFSGNFSANLAYTGMIDFSNNDFNEISALPVRHIVSTVFTYSY
jgi:hypothetical protein